MSTTRQPSHAGSWYTDSGPQLNNNLDGWLADVNAPVKCIGPVSEGQTISDLPVPGGRMIIAPHAGYSYSGPAAAWAYRAWDVSKAKRVFLLGPSHHFYLTKAALTRCTYYGTPLGNLTIDRETTAELHKSGHFDWMSKSVDEEEHSLEMHLPYIYKILSRTFGSDPSTFPPLVPIMVGNTSPSTEVTLGRVFAPYLSDPTTAWVISSDFAHWGLRFNYTLYGPAAGPQTSLTASSKAPTNPPIHESIRRFDFDCIAACEGGSHMGWLESLEDTKNTVCGRHPIGVMMAAVEELRKKGGLVEGRDGRFKFVRYERSGEVRRVSESSVSYASAFAAV